MTKFETNLSAVIEELQNKDVAQDAKDVDLQNQIDSEIAKRTNDDDQLQANINAEANDRAVADKDLQGQIYKEVADRVDADKVLQANIDEEIAARANVDEVESSTRASAVQDLQKQINFVMKYLVPVGAIDYFARASSPEGWLKADGSAVSRTQYVDLFSAVGTMFGAGDGSTTFNLPDLRGEFVRGFDDGRGVDSGRVLGSLQVDEFKSHKHPMISWNNGNNLKIETLFISPNVVPQTLLGGLGGSPGSSYANIPGMTITENTWPNAAVGYSLQQDWYGQPGGTETRPRSVALLACIKY